jgi:hypothetical protein
MTIKNIFNLIEEIQSSSENKKNTGLLIGLGANAGFMTNNQPISSTAIGAGIAGLSAYYLLKHLKSKKKEEETSKNIGKQIILR